MAREVSSRLLYMVSILDVLRMSGGSLPSGRIAELMVSLNLARSSDVTAVQLSGETRFAKEIRFARLELMAAGLLDCPQHGTWALSDAGWSALLTVDGARALVTARRHGRRIGETAAEFSPEGPTTGPRPSSYTTVISYDAKASASIYVLRFGNSGVWKIGRAKNVSVRLKQINKHIPFEILNQRWHVFAKMNCHTYHDAHALEQHLLTILSSSRTAGERVRCSREDLSEAWRLCLAHAAATHVGYGSTA